MFTLLTLVFTSLWGYTGTYSLYQRIESDLKSFGIVYTGSFVLVLLTNPQGFQTLELLCHGRGCFEKPPEVLFPFFGEPLTSCSVPEQLITLRGSILEDATPTATKHGTGRGLPLKDALEYVIPELNIHCLRLALNTPKVTEQLLKLDEQGVSWGRVGGGALQSPYLLCPSPENRRV